MTAATPEGALLGALTRGLLPPGAALLVACSGGLDSMALLHALVALDRWPLEVGTVDHGMRAGSTEDAEQVLAAARRVGVRATLLHADPGRIGRGEGPEEAARRERYRLLESHLAACGAHRLVTAHTADDQGETLLMRLALGAGARGMAGIPEERGRIVRPWLAVSRSAVRTYADAHGLQWRDDPTNAEDRFLRNRVRQRVVPALAEIFGPGWSGVAARSPAHVRGDVEALEFLLRRWRTEAIDLTPKAVTLRLAALDGAPAAVRRLLLRDVIELGAGRAGIDPPRDLGLHLDQIEDLLLTGDGIRSLDVGGGLVVRRAFGRLVVTTDHPADGAVSPLIVDGPGRYAWGRFTLTLTMVDRLPEASSRGDGCVGVSSAPFPWCLRAARPGDRFQPFASPGSRPVTRVWMDADVPRSLRPTLPVIEADGRLIWLPAARVAQGARVLPNSSAVRIDMSPSWKSLADDAPRCPVEASNEG